jgi:hypothetical protein
MYMVACVTWPTIIMHLRSLQVAHPWHVVVQLGRAWISPFDFTIPTHPLFALHMYIPDARALDQYIAFIKWPNYVFFLAAL